MKRLLLSCILLSCLCGFKANAATVSGVVSNATTCSTVPMGHMVFLMDTFRNVIDSTFTNSSGYYSMNFPSSWSSGQHYLITNFACGAMWGANGIYSGSNATINLVTCGSAKTLHGTVMLGSTPNAGPAVVYLVKVQRNFPTAGDTTLTAVDSNVLTSTGGFSFTRLCTPTDTFLIKAALRPAHTSYSNYLPSYDSSLSWSTARRYYGSSFTSSPASGYNIYLFSGTNPGGPGFIGGSVLVGANKGTAVGDPLAKRLMILTTSTGAPVAYTYSDATGKFSFPSVATGTYRLFGDSWGLYNVPLTVTVSSTNLNVNNIIFEEQYGKNTFEGRFASSGVSVVSGPLAGVSLYPNPTTTSVSVMGLNQIRGAKTVELRNMLGATVVSKMFADGEPVEVITDRLSAGTYILKLTTEVGIASLKVTK